MAKLTLLRLQGGYLSTASVNANQVLTEAALENTLSRDGTTPNVMNADIDMNSAGRLVNLKDAVANQEPVTLAQAALLAGVTNALTQDTVAAVFWPQSALETANSATATELQFYYGNVQRFGAKLDGSTDDTSAFNTAITSGYAAFQDFGTAAINGTIVIATQRSLVIKSASAILQRFAGSATTPMIHMYGNNAYFDGGGCTIRQNLYDHPKGIILIGPDPDEDENDTSAISCRFIACHNFKMVGPEGSGPNAPVQLVSPGVYIHSNARRGAAFSGQVTYRTHMDNIEIVNCDILMELSSDANSNVINTFYGHGWFTAALYFNSAYGNLFSDVQFESALATGASRRFAIHFEKSNAGSESDTSGYGIDAAQRNKVSGYAELKNSPSNLQVSLFTHTEDGSNFGENVMDFTGNLGGGAGIGGLSDETAMGTNTLIGPGFTRHRGHIVDFNGYSFRELDDASDTGYFMKDSWAMLMGRKSAIAEATQTNIFSLDAIGANAAGACIKLTYVAKADTVTSVQVGEVFWGIFQEATGNRQARKVSETMTTFDETQIITPNIVLAEGASSALTIATIGFLTTAPAGTNLFYISWKAELMSTETEANANFDLYIKLL